jgi:hypothetical protein
VMPEAAAGAYLRESGSLHPETSRYRHPLDGAGAP